MSLLEPHRGLVLGEVDKERLFPVNIRFDRLDPIGFDPDVYQRACIEYKTTLSARTTLAFVIADAEGCERALRSAALKSGVTSLSPDQFNVAADVMHSEIAFSACLAQVERVMNELSNEAYEALVDVLAGDPLLDLREPRPVLTRADVATKRLTFFDLETGLGSADETTLIEYRIQQDVQRIMLEVNPDLTCFS